MVYHAASCSAIVFDIGTCVVMVYNGASGLITGKTIFEEPTDQSPYLTGPVGNRTLPELKNGLKGNRSVDLDIENDFLKWVQTYVFFLQFFWDQHPFTSYDLG